MLQFSFGDLLTPQAAALAAFLGILLHAFALRFGEWDLLTVKFIVGFFAAIPTLVACFIVYVPELHNNVWVAFKGAVSIELSVLGGVYGSMLVYRAVFHRLGRFPGPFAARLSNLWITGKAIRKQDKCLHIQQLHKKYGDVVRIGNGPIDIFLVDRHSPN